MLLAELGWSAETTRGKEVGGPMSHHHDARQERRPETMVPALRPRPPLTSVFTRCLGRVSPTGGDQCVSDTGAVRTW